MVLQAQGRPAPPRAQRRERLKAEIARLFAVHGKYGSPRITADLREAGWRVCENTVAALMRELHLAARRKRRRRSATRPGRGQWRGAGPGERNFPATGINTKDHAVAALHLCATPINRAGQYTTLPDTTRGLNGTSTPKEVDPPWADGSDRIATRAYLERVTRIELALSAWEAQRLRLPGALTRRPWRPRVTLVAPSSPWLMAR